MGTPDRASVVLLCRDDARFVADAVGSVRAQRGVEAELVVVDEGLDAAGRTRVDYALERAGLARATRVAARDCAAIEAIARGVAAASEPVVALLEADDVFSPDRLVATRAATFGSGDRFIAFSPARFIDAIGEPCRADSEAVLGAERAWLDASRFPSVGFALLRQDLARGRSNLVFQRALFETIRADVDAAEPPAWALLLAALEHVEPVLVPETLVSLRDRGASKPADAATQALRRRDRVVAWAARVRARRPANPLAPGPESWPVYFDLFVARTLAETRPEKDDDDAEAGANLESARSTGLPDAWRAWCDAAPVGAAEGRDFLVDARVPAAERAALAMAREWLMAEVARSAADRRALVASFERVYDEHVHDAQRERPARPWPEPQPHATSPARETGAGNDVAMSRRTSWRSLLRGRSVARLARTARHWQRIRASGVFDAPFYRAQAREQRRFVVEPILHYLRTAETLSLSPHPLFDTRYYLARNPDVRGVLNPLVHYLVAGDAEGRRPHWLFDPEWYRIRHPDVDDRGDHTLVHYLAQGVAEGRAGNPRHDLASAIHAATGADGLEQWKRFLTELDEGTDEHGSRIALRRALEENDARLERGRPLRDGRRLRAHARALRRSRLFDPDFYTLWWGRERRDGGDAARHFLEIGAIEGVGFCGIDRIHERLEALSEGFETGDPPEGLAGLATSLSTATSTSLPNSQTREPLAAVERSSASAGGAAPQATPHVVLHASSRGNLFFTEMTELLAHGFERAGAQVELRDERTPQNDAALAAGEHRIVIAPHEFFLLGRGPEHLSSAFLETSSLWLAEQPGSEFFAMNMWFGRFARRILDINPLSALAWQELGYDARALPLGYVDGFGPYRDAQTLSDSALEAGLRPSARVPVKVDAPLSSRPIDVCFNGVLTPRREAFFARHAGLFGDLECALHMPSPHTPVSVRLASALSPPDATALAQRSKILLNVHRGETGYFEWHRLVVRGLWQQCVVLSETSMPVPWLEAGEHYVEAELDDLPDRIQWLLSSDEGREAAERIRRAGFARLREKYDLVSLCTDFLRDDARHVPGWSEEARS